MISHCPSPFLRSSQPLKMARSRKAPLSKFEIQAPKHIGSIQQLKTWDEIPPWQQDNEYIRTGYRPATASFIKCFQSLRYIHNETINIYSHVLGAVVFLLLPVPTFYSVLVRYPRASQADRIVFSTFFYGVSFCFVLSATYHIITNHSPKVQRFGNQLDYLGIVILMWGSTIPSIYYGLYCDPTLQKLYWANVSVLAIICIVATLHPKFRHPTIRPYRAAMYAALGLSAVAFVVHGILLHGFEIQNRRMSLAWMGLMAGFNLVGAVLYAIRVRSRFLLSVQDRLAGPRLPECGIKAYLNNSFLKKKTPDNMMCMAVVTKYCMLRSYLQGWHTSLVCSRPLTICTHMAPSARDEVRERLESSDCSQSSNCACWQESIGLRNNVKATTSLDIVTKAVSNRSI